MKPQVVESRYDFRGGRNTAISPDLLNPNELVDVTNARLSSTYGGFTKRTGSQRIHQTAFPGAVDGMTQWDSPTGKQVVVISGSKLWWRNGFDFTSAFTSVTPAQTLRSTNNGTDASKAWSSGVSGQNALTLNAPGTVIVAAGSRLVCKLGDPNQTDGSNIPSIDGNYTLSGFKLNINTTGASFPNGGFASSTVTFEYSTDSGVTWNPVAGISQSLGLTQSSGQAGANVTQAYGNTVFFVSGSPAKVWIRAIYTLYWTGGTGTVTGFFQVFNTVWQTDIYTFSWATTGGTLTPPVTFAPFRASTSGAPLVLYLSAGGHLWSWDGNNPGTLTQLDIGGNPNQVPAASAIMSYHTRMFAMTAIPGRIANFPKTIFWSKIGDATNFVAGNKAAGGSAVTDFLTGQQLTALEVIGSSLLMSTSDSLMRFTGHASDDIVISQDTEGISAEVGSVSAQTLKRFENVAAMLTDRGPYVVTETYSQPLGEQLNPDWQALDTANLKNASIEYNRFRKELLFAVPRAGDMGVPKTIFSQTVRLQAWQGPWIYPFAINYQCKYYDANNSPNTLAGGTDGFVRLMDIGNLDDVLFNGTGGSNIAMTVEIPVLHFGVPGLKKALHWMLLQGNLPIGSNLQVNVAFDGGPFTSFAVQPNDLGEEYYRVDTAGDTAQGFRCRVQFVDASPFNVTINGFTILAYNYQRTT